MIPILLLLANAALAAFVYPRAGDFVGRDRSLLVQFDSLATPLNSRSPFAYPEPALLAATIFLYKQSVLVANLSCIPIDGTHCEVVDLSGVASGSHYTLGYADVVSQEFTVISSDAACLAHTNCASCVAAGCKWDSSHWMVGRNAWYTECVTSSRTDLASSSAQCAALAPEKRGERVSKKYYYSEYQKKYASLYGLPDEASLAEMRMHTSEADVNFNEDTETFYPSTVTSSVDTCSWNYFDFEQDDCQVVVGMYMKSQTAYSSDKAPACTVTVSCKTTDNSWATLWEQVSVSDINTEFEYSRTVPSSGPWSNSKPSTLGTYYVRMSTCIIDRKKDVMNLVAKTATMSVNVTYRANSVAGWRTGTGKVWLDPEHKNYFHHQVNFVRALVTGTVTTTYDSARPWSAYIPRSIAVDTVGYGDQNDGRLDYSYYISKWWWGRVMTTESPKVDILTYRILGHGDWADQSFLTLRLRINGADIDVDADKVKFVLNPETIIASSLERSFFVGIPLDLYSSKVHVGYSFIYNNAGNSFNLTFSDPKISLAVPLAATTPLGPVTAYERWVQVQRKDSNPAYTRVGVAYRFKAHINGVDYDLTGRTICEDMQIH